MLTITLFCGLSVKCINNCFLQSSTIIFRLTGLNLRKVVFINRNTVFHSYPIGWFAVHSNIEQSTSPCMYCGFCFLFFISLWKILSRILAPTHLCILYAYMHACLFAYTYICGYLYFYKNTDMCMYMVVSSVSAILSVILALTPSLLYSILHYSLCHYCVNYFDVVHLWQVLCNKKVTLTNLDGYKIWRS